MWRKWEENHISPPTLCRYMKTPLSFSLPFLLHILACPISSILTLIRMLCCLLEYVLYMFQVALPSSYGMRRGWAQWHIIGRQLLKSRRDIFLHYFYWEAADGVRPKQSQQDTAGSIGWVSICIQYNPASGKQRFKHN